MEIEVDGSPIAVFESEHPLYPVLVTWPLVTGPVCAWAWPHDRCPHFFLGFFWVTLLISILVVSVLVCFSVALAPKASLVLGDQLCLVDERIALRAVWLGEAVGTRPWRRTRASAPRSVAPENA